MYVWSVSMLAFCIADVPKPLLSHESFRVLVTHIKLAIDCAIIPFSWLLSIVIVSDVLLVMAKSNSCFLVAVVTGPHHREAVRKYVASNHLVTQPGGSRP